MAQMEEFIEEDAEDKEEYDDLIPRLSEVRVQIRHLPRAGWSRRTYFIIAVIGACLLVFLTIGLSVNLNRHQSLDKAYTNGHQSLDKSIQSTGGWGKKQDGHSEEKLFKKAAVANDAAHCSKIGADILRKNGSAVDAAIATQLCDGVYNAYSTGIGGGFFMVVYSSATGEIKIIDAREEAPGGATRDMFHHNPDLSQKGGLAVAVPGELKGYEKAHTLYGNLPWSELFQPTVSLCRNGYRVTNALAKKLRKKEDEIRQQPSMAEIYINPETGEVYREGDIMKRPKLANTLERIGRSKAKSSLFYQGDLGKDFVEDVQGYGGILTTDDLCNYQVKVHDPVAVEIGDDVLYSVPPPGSGAVLGLALNILRGFGMNPDSITDAESRGLAYHRVMEAYKFAYAQRFLLGDPDFVANVSEVVKNMTSERFADELREKITDDSTHDPDYYGGIFASRGNTGTAHTCVMKLNGDAVAITSTINTIFGAMRRSQSTGIILNNEMDDFSAPNMTNYFDLPPAPANFIEPGKRPQSSMSPSIILDKEKNVKMVLGASGGSYIPTAASWT